MIDKASTIEDVASSAGVSVVAARRALRSLPNVEAGDRALVHRAAEELRYQPKLSSIALGGGSNRVTLVVPGLDSWYFSRVMAGAEAVLSESGCEMLLYKVDGDEGRRRFLSGPLLDRSAGLILVDVPVPDDELAAVLERNIRVASVGIDLKGASLATVDDSRIATEAVEHLVSLGHRDIAIIGGEIFDEILRTDVPRKRRIGYEEALASHGIPLRDDYEVSGSFSQFGGNEAMGKLLSLDHPPTAVFTSSDEMAFGAMQRLAVAGISVPNDMSIVGVDDHEFASVLGLTTFRQNVVGHGAAAARLVLEGLEDPALPPRRHVSSFSFVERTSTARAPQRDQR